MNTPEAAYMRATFPAPPPQSFYEGCKWPALWPQTLAGCSVLDLGCCQGWIGWLAQQSGAFVVGTDIFREACHPDVPFLLASKEALPLPDGCCDWVLTANTLHHGDLAQTCLEAHRVLRPGGQFLSLQEPCIPVLQDEAQYLREHCREELALDIQERRPNVEQYLAALRVFGRVTLELCNGDPRDPRGHSVVPQTPDSTYHGGIRVLAQKAG